jgi:hypothetical protein
MKMKAKKLPKSSSPTVFATATARSRKIRSGISGAAECDSIIRKASSSAAETAREEAAAGRQPRAERCPSQHSQAQHQDPPAAEQVRGSAASNRRPPKAIP